MRLSPFFAARMISMLLLAAAFRLVPCAHAAPAVDGDALSLVVTYHATPGNRAGLLDLLGTEGPNRFAKWQQEGVVRQWQLLFNRYPSDSAWDAMAVLTFARPSDVARWSGIERRFPGGMTPQEAGLVAAIDTVPVDLVRDKREARKGDNPVFLVIPYKVLVSADEYLEYADGYALPQFDGWIAEGILAGYRIYQSAYPAGRPWSTLLVLEYRSDAALSERDAVKDKVRARLKNDAKWKAISDNKKSIRDELEVVVAEQLEARGGGK
jgi:hypothetical protein